MCGIVGIVSLGGGPIDLGVLQRMNDIQAHRGPDGEGFLLGELDGAGSSYTWLHRATAKAEAASSFRIGLGHRRLAILDLSDRGLQPMTVEDSGLWIVFNGEIYNHVELRTELQGRGCKFTTRTDTEVLLQAYRQWGDDCLARLEGMFAFAIWDDTRRRLFCARDRFGIKPFYYTYRDGFLAFASEIKALLVLPGLSAVADDDAVLGFLVHGNCDFGERTALRGISALPAGHCLSVDIGGEEPDPRRYYSLCPHPTTGRTDEESIVGLRDLLLATLRRHLISDVRAGSCLSGGLDSSTVVSLIGAIRRDEPEAAVAVGDKLQTFTSCYEHREIDERDYALAVAESIGAEPHLVFPSAADFWADFERLTWHQDMPFGSLSFYAQWRVMRAAQEAGVKVLLDGQGGDEVFGGYAKFRYAYLVSLLRSGSFPTFVRELAAMLRQGDRYVLDLRKGFRYLPKSLRRLLDVDSVLREVVVADWNRIVSDRSTPATRWWRHAAGADGEHGSTASATIMQKIQIDDILTDTLPQLLRFEDRSSMAFSIEARVPLLDHKLVEYGLSLPDHLKVNNGWSKHAVRAAMRGSMPETVRMRKSKLGFAAPDRLWLSQDLRTHINELLGGDLRCRKYVDAEALRSWYNSERSAKSNTESFLGLFRIMSLEMWMRMFSVS